MRGCTVGTGISAGSNCENNTASKVQAPLPCSLCNAILPIPSLRTMLWTMITAAFYLPYQACFAWKIMSCEGCGVFFGLRFKASVAQQCVEGPVDSFVFATSEAFILRILNKLASRSYAKIASTHLSERVFQAVSVVIISQAGVNMCCMIVKLPMRATRMCKQRYILKGVVFAALGQARSL